MRPLIVFDDRKGLLGPLLDLRASFDVRTGALTSLDRFLRDWEGPLAGLRVPESLAAIVRDHHRHVDVNGTPSDDTVIAVNGRCVLPPAELARLEPGQVLIEAESGDAIAAVATELDVAAGLERGEFDGTPVEYGKRCLLHRPWDVRRFRDEAIQGDLAAMAGHNGSELPDQVVRVGDEALTIHPSAEIYQQVTLDTEAGPIFIDEMVKIRPGAVIIGPVYLGKGTIVLDQAIIKPFTAIGPTCKVAGEVGGTIFQGYSNKAHDGHLGDSWVGKWVNLGAGTVNSNLLNTYGEVTARATPDGPMERTGERYLGCVLGDHVKTAIGTRIMTGAVMHTGAMWAASAPVSGCVERFAWVTDERRQRYRLERFLEVAQTVTGRRNVTPVEEYWALVRELHAAAER